MGIRVHKVMGYGLQYCKFSKDPRLNKDIFKDLLHNSEDLRQKLVDYINNQKGKISKDSHLYHWIEIEKSAIESTGLYSNLPNKPITAYDVIKYSYFNADKKNPIGPFILTVPYYKEWFRYDDAMDYQEQSQFHLNEKLTDVLTLLTDNENQAAGIFPYSDVYINRTTGLPLKNIGGSYGRTMITKLLKEGKCNRKALKEKYGIYYLNEWRKNIVPVIPPFIEIFCDCFKIFKNPLMKYRLKPMIYTYWS